MILSDIARCIGISVQPKCKQCARRLQIALDDPKRWYPYMPAAVTLSGACQFFIKEHT